MASRLVRAKKTAFSPRRASPTLAKLKLTAPAKRQDTESLADKLFESSLDVANATLGTEFIQGIKTGTLDPTCYGGYTVQDAVYVHHGSKVMRALALKAKAQDLPDLEAFAKHHAKSWEEYATEMFQQWHLADPKAVSLGPAAQNYLDYQNRVLAKYSPYYMILSLLPCDMLWEWLGNELKPLSTPSNLYSFWIDENSKGNRNWEDFVDAHMSRFKWDEALAVFHEGMTHEKMMFESACEHENA